MSLNEQIIRQRDFSGGMIHPDALRRDDIELLASCLRSGTNMVSSHTGALTPRPGRRLLFQDTGVIKEFKPFDDTAYRLTFSAGAVKVRTTAGALVTTLAAPWGADDIDSLVFESMDNEVFVTWPGGIPQVITIAPGTLAWSIGNFAFEISPDSTVRVPFYRFPSTANIKMKPSARSGAISFEFNGPVLTASHVGAIIRYAGRQLRITGVTDSQHGTANCLEEIPNTFKLQIYNIAGFSVGQSVAAELSDFQGEIYSIVGDLAYVLCTGRIARPISDELLISQTASSNIIGIAEENVTAFSVQWDEQFASNARGWPRSVSKDRQRLIFTNFPQFKNAILWSATGANRDCLIGSDPDDAMLEFVSAECQIFHVVGGYDEFVIADKGVWYVPVSVGTPLQPGSVEFRPIFSSELANVRPVEVTEGVIFVDKTRTGVYAITATGQTARPYVANEINRFHRHLFKGVKSLAVTSGTEVFPTRQIYAVNADGTVAIGQFNADKDYVGWFPWSGAGAVSSASGNYGAVLFMSSYTFGMTTVSVAEEVDYSLLFDCATTIESSASAPFYANREVDIYAGGFYLGKTTVAVDGTVSGFDEYDEITLGVMFDWDFVPLFSRFDDGQPVGQGEKKRKVEHMQITVRGTQEFQVGNRSFGSYRGGDDMSEPVADRDDTYRYREVGRSYDPMVPFRSTFPGKFKLIELATRITV